MKWVKNFINILISFIFIIISYASKYCDGMIFAVGICEGGDVFVYYSKPRYKVPVKCSRNAEEVGDKKANFNKSY